MVCYVDVENAAALQQQLQHIGMALQSRKKQSATRAVLWASSDDMVFVAQIRSSSGI
jgi:hypothetical protein